MESRALFPWLDGFLATSRPRPERETGSRPKHCQDVRRCLRASLRMPMAGFFFIVVTPLSSSAVVSTAPYFSIAASAFLNRTKLEQSAAMAMPSVLNRTPFSSRIFTTSGQTFRPLSIRQLGIGGSPGSATDSGGRACAFHPLCGILRSSCAQVACDSVRLNLYRPCGCLSLLRTYHVREKTFASQLSELEPAGRRTSISRH